MNNNTKLLCLFLKAQKIAKSSEQGYSMLVVSVLTIMMFSLVLAATSLSNMAKSRTNAFVDGTSTFYVAEAGLNKRAAEINTKLKGYSGVSGPVSLPGESLTDCFGVGIPAGGSGESPRSGNNDLECVNYRFMSSNNIASATSTPVGSITVDSGGKNQNTYVAYTLVTDRTNYVNGAPQFAQIPPGEDYAGLNAAEYRYEISATGKKPLALPQVSTTPVYSDAQIAAKNRQTTGAPQQAGDSALIAAYDSIKSQTQTARAAATTAAQDSSNNTTLSMTFRYRTIPLFQFGIFYNGDLELNSTSNMQINGWVHSNANMYLQPAGLPGVPSTATFGARVSAAGSIYNRVDAWEPGLVNRPGITRLLRTGTTNTFDPLPAYNYTAIAPLSATQISAIPNGQLQYAATVLRTPSPGFTRKRNYATNAIGEYFAKADLRLEMVPDRDVTSKPANTPWTRENDRIPFNFTAITTSGTGTCTTTAPTAGSDPAATYVDLLRENLTALRCNVFNKGQLQSLRQPVMVLTNINQNRSNSAFTTAQFRAWESQALGAPPLPTPPPLLPAANTDATKRQIIRALQVAIASTPRPIQMQRLNQAFNGGTGIYNANTGNESLRTFRDTFTTLLNNITLDPADRTNLLNASPNQIAALMGAWFLPAPIQRIERPTPDTVDTTNSRSSGFYDGRERRWITMLQTNIASLSVWNRDGLYVQADNETLTLPYNPAAGATAATFGGGSGTTNNTNGLAFDRVTAFTNTSGSEIYPADSLQYLGLGGRDTTEGGLIFHATVSDDLDGSGGALVPANDVTVNTSDNTQRILKKRADNTNELDSSGNPIIIDYYRRYPGQNASRQSPFAFAVNGGNYLPNSMMFSSDQSVYIQGNFNNSSNSFNDLPTNLPNTAPNIPDPDRLPAAIVADTITVLSNQCINANNPLGVPLGQLTCGLPPQINGAPQNYNNVTSAIAINAAFLSNTQVSNGNRGNGRYNISLDKSYSGGVNNYIRLLEDWNQNNNPIALNYSGSLISLNEPIEYGGLYREGGIDPLDPVGTSYYNVPFRNFNYDLNFNSVTRIPPLTPKVSYVLQNSFNRKY